MEEDIANYSTFDGLRPHFDALARGGYFKIVLKPLSPVKRCLHNTYRFIACFLVLTYNIQHIIRVVLVRHSTDLMVDTLFILLTTLGTLGKQAAFNLRSSRIDGIINTINGPYFSASNFYHVNSLKANAVFMARILSFHHGAVAVCGSLWAMFPVVNRALGEEVSLTGYFPFDTTGTPTFELALIYMSVLITFQAYGNVSMDCTITAFYSQAQVQIQILRYNLERLINAKSINTMLSKKFNENRLIDDEKEKIAMQQRFKKCVVHFQQIVGFTKEVESIFGEAMVVQFFISAWVICMTMYKIVGLDLLSAEFISMAIYLCCMLSQLFIYCYFGTQLKVESEFINRSIYSCAWLYVSPKFRRQLLLMMQRCSRPLSPRIAYIIPMSLETYIAVLKSSYTLFTFLKNK